MKGHNRAPFFFCPCTAVGKIRGTDQPRCGFFAGTANGTVRKPLSNNLAGGPVKPYLILNNYK